MWRGRGGVGLVLLIAAGCGRIGFDGSDGDGGAGGDDEGPSAGSMPFATIRFDGITTAVDGLTDPSTAPRDGERLQIGDGTCPGYTGGMMQPYRAILVENAT